MELRNERRNERKKKCFKSKQSQNVHINSGKKHRKKKRSNQCVRTETEQQPTETIKKRNF